MKEKRMDISSSDMATLTVLRKELLDIKAQNISVPNIVMEYLSNRISSIESGNSVMVDWKHNSIEPFQIYSSNDELGRPASEYFYPEVSYCGISIKDEYRDDNPHTDHEKDTDYIKILGLLNSNWNEKDGGAFIHGKETVHMKSGNFVIFDPRVSHCAAKIKTHEKRIGIDFTVRRKK